MSKKRVSYLFSFAAASVLAAALAGCGGSSSGDAPAVVAAPGAGGGAAVVVPGAPAAATAPTGTAPVTVTALTATQFAALTPVAAVGGVAINSPPVVTFSLADGATTNNPIVGWGLTNQSATATVPSQAFLRFSLAKLVPGTNGSPSKWVNYIVTTMPTYKSATDKTIVPSAPRTPTTDSEGTLVDNKNGTYTYTFARDITKMKDTVAAMTVASPNVLADLGDLTYEPTLTHRLTIQISGNARGTGTNTADGSNSGVTAVPLANPINVIYDFIPATGKKVTATDTQREVVVKAVCNECHEKLTLHGSRNETQYCVVCHNDQLKYGKSNVASALDATSKIPTFPALTETATVDATTGITSYRYSPTMSVADGDVLGNFPVMVHRLHNGASLVKDNYNLANVVLDNKGFSMLGNGQRMCIKCHDSAQAAQADNFNKVPSRLACGGCHDGIKWSDGTGSTLGDKATYAAAKTQKATGTGTASTATLAASGHLGKGQSSDATCALCHSSADIKVYHRTENVTKHNPTVTPGLVHFTYDIKSAAVNSSNDLSIVFKIDSATADANGVLGTAAPVKFVAAGAGVAAPLTGFTGSPSFQFSWAEAQDNIATPIDYNNKGVKQAQVTSTSIANLLNTSHANAANQSLSGPDASGYYTATLKGTGTTKFPVGAKLRAVGLQGYFTQAAGTNSITAATARHAVSALKAVTGDTARRIVVDNDKCANCHEWFEGHGGNRVSNIEICVQCHVPGMATSGRGISDAVVSAWTWTADEYKIVKEWKTKFGFDQSTTNAALKFPVTTNNFKDMIHGIHSGRERVNPFVDARDRTPSAITLLDFRRMDFPGKLNNCETCHKAGTYSNVSASALASTYESIDAAYAAAITAGTATPALAKTALSTANNDDKVTSPFAAACISCHDSVAAQSHVAKNGGAIMVTRATFATNNVTAGGGEACVTCHGTGKSEDIAVKHAK